MANISNNPKGKMDKYLGMYREDDTVFSDFVDKGGYYEDSSDKPVLIDYVTRINRIRVEVKNDNAARTFRILDSAIII